MAGVSLNDRHLSSRVRSKLLKEIEFILDGDNLEAKKELVMKMCTTVLPRLNEVTGADGKDLMIPIYGGRAKGTIVQEQPSNGESISAD